MPEIYFVRAGITWIGVYLQLASRILLRWVKWGLQLRKRDCFKRTKGRPWAYRCSDVSFRERKLITRSDQPAFNYHL